MASPQVAYFGCGCFWTKEYLFGKMAGVLTTRAGYMGGTTADPTYHAVCTKKTGHAEVVEVTFDSEQTSINSLLKGFFGFHDATQDRSAKGGQYRSVVFWRKPEERTLLQEIFSQLREKGLNVSTSIEEAGMFWEAEPRHQGYVNRTGRTCDLSPTLKLAERSLEEIVRSRAI